MAKYTGYDNWTAEQQNDSYQNEISHNTPKYTKGCNEFNPKQPFL